MTDMKRLPWDEMLKLPIDKLEEHSFVPIRIFDNADDMFVYLARYTVDLVKENNLKGLPTSIIWPCGPKKQFPHIARITNEEKVSWKNTYNIQMDEWLTWDCRPLPKEHPFNLQSYIRRNLFGLIDPALAPEEENMIFLDPMDMGKVDRFLDGHGPVDVVFGGFGFTGHFAYNEPYTCRWGYVSNEEFVNCRTRIVATTEETFIMHAHRSTGGNTRLVPQFGITVGMQDLLKAKRIRLVSDGGAWKQTIFRLLCMHEPTVKYPCTFVQTHNDAEVIVDAVTAEAPAYDFSN